MLISRSTVFLPTRLTSTAPIRPPDSAIACATFAKVPSAVICSMRTIVEKPIFICCDTCVPVPRAERREWRIADENASPHIPAIPEEIFVRRTLALAVIAITLCVNVGGCSTPVDTGSNIPAQSQPIYTVLALLGLGIAITAFHHP